MRTRARSPVHAVGRAEREHLSGWGYSVVPTTPGGKRRCLSTLCTVSATGAHLGDVVQEEYVRRLTSPEEVEQILDNPKLIEAARKALGEDFSSGKLDPH